MGTTTTIDVRNIASPMAAPVGNGGFRIPFTNIWAPAFSKGRSLAALIYLAMVADGFASIEEEEEVYALIDRTQTLRHLNKKASQDLLEKVVELIRAKGHTFVLEKACRAFRGKPSAESVFMHVADIVLADRALLDNEQRMLENVAFHLHLDRERARDLFEIMNRKNKY